MLRSLLLKGFLLSILLVGCISYGQPSPTLSEDSLELLISDLEAMQKEHSVLGKQVRAAYRNILDGSNYNNRGNYLSRLSLALVDFPDSALFRQVNQAAIHTNRVVGDSLALGDAYWDLAYRMQRESRRDSSFYYYSQARSVFEAKGETSKVANLSIRMAWLQNLLRDYQGAEANLIAAIRQFEALEDIQGLHDAYNLLGVNAKDQGLYDQSFDYYEKVSEYLKEMDASPDRWKIFYNNLGNVFRASGDHATAMAYYQKALEDTTLLTRKPASFSLYTSNLGKAYYELGQYKNAEAAYLEALQVRDSMKNPSDLASSHYFLAELYSKIGQDSLALTHLYPGLEFASQANSPERLLELYVLGGELEPDSAAAYLRKYNALDKRLQAAELDERNRFARIQFQTDQYIEQNEFLARRQLLYLGILAAILLLGTATFIIITQRIKNQKLRFEQKQQEANQEIFQLMLSQKAKVEEGKKKVQKRISEELHDGVLGEMNGIRMVLLGLNGKSDPDSLAMREQAIMRLQEIQEAIRGISHELSDAAYEKFHNFIVSIEELIEQTCRPAGLDCGFTFDQDMDWDQLPGLAKINLHRIIQECLQNTIKHAEASRVDIFLETTAEDCVVRVCDDGKGITASRGKKGIGQKNISSRVAKMNGDWKVVSRPGKGTEVRIKIPRSYDWGESQTAV